MKRKEFIRIVTGAMEVLENEDDEFSCCALLDLQSSGTVTRDYNKVFGKKYPNCYNIPLGFGITPRKTEKIKQVRLNALAMYLAQSLAFKTYKDL